MDTQRLFFVVYSEMDESELFETLKEAEEHAHTLAHKPIIAICIVRHAFREADNKNRWNYEDRSDTFEEIRNMRRCSICGDYIYGQVQVHHHYEESTGKTA